MLNLFNKIKNIIKKGKKVSQVDESTTLVDFLGKKQKMLVVNPYGLHYNANVGVIAVIMQDSANEDAIMGYMSDPDNVDTLENTEVSVGIPVLLSRVKFMKDGKISVVDLSGNEGGDNLVGYNELKAGFDKLKADFNTFVQNVHNGSVLPHTHSYNPGPGASTQTGTAVIVAGTQSTASIDNSKKENIEVTA